MAQGEKINAHADLEAGMGCQQCRGVDEAVHAATLTEADVVGEEEMVDATPGHARNELTAKIEVTSEHGR